ISDFWILYLAQVALTLIALALTSAGLFCCVTSSTALSVNRSAAVAGALHLLTLACMAMNLIPGIHAKPLVVEIATLASWFAALAFLKRLAHGLDRPALARRIGFLQRVGLIVIAVPLLAALGYALLTRFGASPVFTEEEWQSFSTL